MNMKKLFAGVIAMVMLMVGTTGLAAPLTSGSSITAADDYSATIPATVTANDIIDVTVSWDGGLDEVTFEWDGESEFVLVSDPGSDAQTIEFGVVSKSFENTSVQFDADVNQTINNYVSASFNETDSISGNYQSNDLKATLTVTYTAPTAEDGLIDYTDNITVTVTISGTTPD